MKITVRLAPVIFIAIVIYFIYLIRGDLLMLSQLRKEKADLIISLGLGEKEMDKLKQELSKTKGIDHTEEIARIQLGLIKKGEIAYKVIFK